MYCWKVGKNFLQDGHLTIKVKFDDCLPESFTIKERVENIKDRIRADNRNQNILFTGSDLYFFCQAIITDYKGTHVNDQQLASR